MKLLRLSLALVLLAATPTTTSFRPSQAWAQDDEFEVPPPAEGEQSEMELEPMSTEGGNDAVEELPPAEAAPEEAQASQPADGDYPTEDFDEPDAAYEARLYDIYINFHSEPTPAEQWSVIVGGRESESYKIQRRDTLWGISETFFSDGNFWPKIWSINNKISNPHLIEPGNQIRFLLGDESDAPAFTVTEGETEGEGGEATTDEVAVEGETPPAEEAPAEEPPSTEAKETKPVPEKPGPPSPTEVEIPPPERVSRPVLKKFPPSFPEWQNDNILGTYDELGISIQKRPDLVATTNVSILSYVEEKQPETIGEVKEVETGGLSASDYQYIYVTVKKGEGRSGQKLLVLKDIGELERSNEFVESQSNYGVSIEVQGVVSLSDTVAIKDSSLAKEYDLFRAMVLRAHNPVSVGAKVIRGKVDQVSMAMTGPRSTVVAQIYGGAEDRKRKVFAPQSVAFLNRGSNDGLSPGQILPIRSNRASRVEGSIVNENSRPIGWLKVARVTPTLSTAVVLKAFEDIRVGDLTGRGEMLAAAGDKSGKSASSLNEEGATEEDLTEDAMDELDSGDDDADSDEDFAE